MMHVPRQLPLTLSNNPRPSFNNFITGNNGEILSRLKEIITNIIKSARLGTNINSQATYSFQNSYGMYLWGAHGSGKTHLLQATASALEAKWCRFLTSTSLIKLFHYDKTVKLYIIDNCENLNHKQQRATFNLFNQISSEQHSFLIVSGSTLATHLPIRDDLRSRLAWGLNYQLHSLRDDEKILALLKKAEDKGLKLHEEIIHYLLNHFHRDMFSLSILLDQLDIYSMETKRPVTIPLIKAMLSHSPNHKNTRIK